MKTLIITEKPKVSQRIASALSDKPVRKRFGKVGYFQFSENGDEVYVASAAGHLYSLKQEGDGYDFPVFDISWKPLFEIEKGKYYTKGYIDALKGLSMEADNFIIATDWDIEGELLGYNALRFAGGEVKARRMRFSTLVSHDLRQAYENLSEVDMGLVEAGETRHIMDWYWGINISRALMHSTRALGGRFTISAGRVQTPALSILVKRERDIKGFVPEKFYEIFAHLNAKGTKVKARHELTTAHAIDYLNKQGFSCVLINQSSLADLSLKSSSLLVLGEKPKLILHENDKETVKRLPANTEVKIVKSLDDEIKKIALKGKIGIEKINITVDFVESLEKKIKNKGGLEQINLPEFIERFRKFKTPKLKNKIEIEKTEHVINFIKKISECDCEIKIIKDIAFEIKKDKEEARLILEKSKTKEATVSKVEENELKRYPPVPFDLGELQREAFRVFRFNPKRAQAVAQSLYESGVISYPRTSSQKYPPGIGFKRVIEAISHIKGFELASRLLEKEKLYPRQGKKDDPAHPAIYPTGIAPKTLSKDEERLYGLIVHRFLAAFADPAELHSTMVEVSLGKEPYYFEATRVVSRGWMDYYPYVKVDETILPAIKKGDIVVVAKVGLKEGETKPPNRYNPASLLRVLEEKGLGTKATRAEIVDTLYRRGYIKDVSIKVTEGGMAVIAALEKYVPEIIDEELTRRFEEYVEDIQKGNATKEEVLEEAKKELLKIIEEFRAKEREIGKELLKAFTETRRKHETLGACPSCDGELRIVKSSRTGKSFVGCTNYPKCRTSYPLPQKVKSMPAGKTCPECGLPMVKLGFKGKKVLSCIDLKCPSKQKR